MAKNLLVQWYRGGSDAGHRQSSDVITVQRDNMNPMEAAYYGGESPVFRYDGYVYTKKYAFQYQDLLIDTTNIDPKTGQLARYRIINDPEPFDDNHYELILDRVVGT